MGLDYVEEDCMIAAFFFSSRRRHTRFKCDWSSDVCSSDLVPEYYTADRGWPLVMALHGGSGNGRGFLWSWLRDARSRGAIRSEERRVGKECRSRWSPYH